MTRKRRRRYRPPKKRASSRQRSVGPRLTTPEGDPLIFARAEYRHAALEEIREILKQAEDFDLDDGGKPAPDGSVQGGWLETDPNAAALPDPMSQRILAMLTLAPRILSVETISRQRLYACRRRLEHLLGNRIRHTGTQTKTPSEALREPVPSPKAEPVVLPPDAIAEMEDRMVRHWLDESIPALGGLTPREAVKTPKGRQSVLDLLDYVERDEESRELPPGMFSPDYRKAKRMLGLE